MRLLQAGSPAEYLGSDDVVESAHPDIVEVARQIRRQNVDDEAFAAAAFEWVRDQVAHALDVGDPRVTLSASDVLRHRVGLCFGKSHLLVALLRAEGVPAGLCYQRLRDHEGFVLHGLVAVYLQGGWHRLDPRGNKPGIDAAFSLAAERLAFTVDPASGEHDYATVYAFPAPSVVQALTDASDTLTLCDGQLPARLDPPRWTAERGDPVPDEVARLLATVPEWFGLPDANVEYVEAARGKETWKVQDSDGTVVGVTLVDRHFPHVVEIYLTVVDRWAHGTGAGTTMIEAIEADALRRGVRLMEVKTLGPSHPDPGYARTRRFYEKMGFLPLEETDLWGEDSPCLIMVKPLAPLKSDVDVEHGSMSEDTL